MRGQVQETLSVMCVVYVERKRQYSIRHRCIRWVHKKCGDANGKLPVLLRDLVQYVIMVGSEWTKRLAAREEGWCLTEEGEKMEILKNSFYYLADTNGEFTNRGMHGNADYMRLVRGVKIKFQDEENRLGNKELARN